MKMDGDRIVLGVSGSIAAYKAAEIVRGFRRTGVTVHVAMTANATRFITPLTLQTLSGRPVITDPWELGARTDIEHVELGRRIGCFLLAPATADLLARLARGVADDFLSTFYLAVTCPVVAAPAMNQRMLAHPATRENLEILKGRGVEIIEPEEGSLACREEGPGRLADPDRIVARVAGILGRGRTLADRTVLVTAGPTREAIDPVRFLSNASSGRMGYCLAAEARRRGAAVILVSGPTPLPPPEGVRVEPVVSAGEMRRAVRRHLPAADAVFQVAAVADFRPRRAFPEKWKRARGLPPLELEPTPDILAEIVRERRQGTVVVGFAAETAEVAENARRKREEKGVDLLVACDVTRHPPGAAAAAMTVWSEGGATEWPLLAKEEIAARLLDLVGERVRK